MKFALELEGLTVRLFKDGAALPAEPDLPGGGCIVVDCSMPGMNGIELISRLRQRDVNDPAILIASHVTGDLQGRAARTGFRKVLEKPLHDSDLLDSINAVLA